MTKYNGLSLFSNVGIAETLIDKSIIDFKLANELLQNRVDFYKHNHPGTNVIHGDITNNDIFNDIIKQSIESSVNFILATPPCFIDGTKIITSTGLKNIEDVNIDDMVITHANRFHKVLATGGKMAKTITVRAQGFKPTETTHKHPYYVRTMSREWDSENRTYKRVFSSPYWKNAEDLTKGDFLGSTINNENSNILELTDYECYILGRYIADGHTRKDTTSNGNRRWELVLSIGSRKIDKFKSQISTCKFNISKHTKNVYRATFYNKRLVEIAENYCGIGAINKVIPQEMLNLPKKLLEIVINGYIDGDGSERMGVYRATTISENLVITLAQAVAKVYRVNSNYEYTKRPPTTIIEGRTVNQRDTYTISFKKIMSKQSRAKLIDETIWTPFKSYIENLETKLVHNLEVETDNSYTANNAIVHNCQGMSQVGKMEPNDPRNTLIKRVVQATILIQPDYLVIENVPQMPDTYITDYNNEPITIRDYILTELSSLYNIEFHKLNTADYGTPQSRKRTIVIASRIGSKQLVVPNPTTPNHITVEQAIGHLPSLSAGESSGIEYHSAKQHNERQILAMSHTPSGKTAMDNSIYFPTKEDGTAVKAFRTSYKRISWDKPAPTITMANGSISSQNNVHPGRLLSDGTYSDARVLTLKELFILTGLPDDWEPPEWASENLTRQVIGEAVPPKLLYEILKQLTN